MPGRGRYTARVSHWQKTACLLLLSGIASLAAAQPYRFVEPERIVAFADVHGAYDELVRLLRAAGIVDARRDWIGGQTHLVSLGDILDRGDDSRAVLDLLMRLETQAAAAGGRVHVVLGNHELMNLTGDLRYVSAGEFAAFADEESPAARDSAWQRFRNDYDDEQQAQQAFAAAFPPGFFGHRAAFSSQGLYGSWLLQRPVLIVIGATAFAHGGMPPLVARLGLDEINRRMSAELNEIVVLAEDLQRAGLIAANEAAVDAAQKIAGRLASDAAPALENSLRDRAQRFIELAASDVFDDDGPLWYRGSALCPVTLESDNLARGLERLGALRIVVGHTPTSSRRVMTRHDGRVVLADTGMSAAHYNGTPAAVEIDADGLEVIYADLDNLREPVAAPADNAAGWVGGVAALEAFLATAAIIDEQEVEGREVLRLRDGVVETTAVRLPRRHGGNELAAYRLDRMLGIGLVPVTVERGNGRRADVLQWRGADWIDEHARALAKRPVASWCAAGNVFDLQYAFDTLTANNGRNAATMLYSDGVSKLWLSDFADAFATASGLPGYLREQRASLRMSPGLANRLGMLDAGALERELGEWLNARARAALLKRRDEMLASWSRAETGEQ